MHLGGADQKSPEKNKQTTRPFFDFFSLLCVLPKKIVALTQDTVVHNTLRHTLLE
jgi:hypothetical protein